jgi:hypothetical protein
MPPKPQNPKVIYIINNLNMFESESSSDGGWISWFCDLEGHDFFVEVSKLIPPLTLLVDSRLTLTTSKIVLI